MAGHTTPKWVKVAGIVAAVVVAVIVAVMIAGGGEHGPGRHLPGHGAPVDHGG